MEKEFKHFLMGESFKANLKTIKWKEKEFSNGQMVKSMMENM